MKEGSLVTKLISAVCLASFLPLMSFAEDGKAFQWVNIGSNSGLFAFDWESAGVNGLNLAGSPQSERRGAGKVKAHREEIAEGAYVVIPLCPFSSVLPESYDLRNSDTTHPLLSFDGMPDEQALSGFSDMLDKCWKKEFAIRDYSDTMTETNRLAYSGCVVHMRGFIAWCRSQGLRPVLVLPPAAESLRKLFPESFMRQYVYDFVRDATAGTDVKFLDYWDSGEFQNPELYATSLLLNKTGRRRFTARVIADCRCAALGQGQTPKPPPPGKRAPDAGRQESTGSQGGSL